MSRHRIGSAIASARGADAELCSELGLPEGAHLHLALDPVISPLRPAGNRLPASVLNAHPRRQGDFMRGRSCAAAALEAAGFSGVTWLPMGDDQLPMWPAGWAGSITHAGRAAMAAVAPQSVTTALGVDMEQLISPGVAGEVRHLVASDDELAVLSNLGESRAITTLFSAKEALYKTLFPFVREFMDFSAARVVAARDNELSLRLAVPWGRLPEGKVIPVRHARRREFVITAAFLGPEGRDPATPMERRCADPLRHT